MKQHDEAYNKGKMRLISFVAFLMGFAQAVLLYVMSTYFKRASGIENIGLFYLVAYAITLIIYLNLHKIIKKIGKSNAFFFSLFFKIIAIVILMNWSPSYITVIVMMFYIIMGNLEWLSLDIIIESFSTDTMSGRIRGRYLTILNAGLLLGPFVSTSLLAKFDFWGVFLALFIFNSLIFVISLFGLANVNHKFEANLTSRALLKKIFKRKNIMRAYYVSFVLEFFYALMIIYTPIYLRDSGLSWEQIGYIFTVMLIPFVLAQYPMGVLADKKFGEKEFMIFSLITMALSTGVIFFIGTSDVAVWALVLFLTRIGAALVEVLRDSYFFKRIDAHDVDIIDFFRTAQSSAYILASIISAIILIFFSIKVIFLVVAFVVFSALIPAIKLRDNKCEEEILAEKAVF
ncbi:MAG: MFS transporter [Parcubacteria group bacterium]|jgi:MFS family permease